MGKLLTALFNARSIIVRFESENWSLSEKSEMPIVIHCTGKRQTSCSQQCYLNEIKADIIKMLKLIRNPQNLSESVQRGMAGCT